MTNNDGRYAVPNVDVGTYNIVFEKQGFATSKVEQQKVDVGTTLTVNTSLQVGATTTTVEVAAQGAAELQTTSASVGTTVTTKEILDLPNLARDASTLAVLQPGITPGGYTAGSVQDQNSYTVDGGMNSDDMAGNSTSYVTNFTGLGGTQTGGSSSGAVPVPVESIEEFKVTTFQQSADFNGGLGSQVQMVTKRGTNQFHGSGYEYYFATNVGAGNSWVNDHTCKPFSPNCVGAFPTPGYANPLPSNHRNRFGASVGGFLTPNFLGGKWYFFFNYEGQRFPNNNTYERPVPSDLLRAGVIQVPIGSTNTWTAFNLNPTAVTVDGVTYPACSGGYCDPRGIGINPIVKQIWQTQMPLGNDPLYGGTGADQHNVIGYLSTLKTPLTDDIYVGRIDHDFTDKWHFFSSYRMMDLLNLTSNQVDIGGVVKGDQLGVPAATAPRDQIPSLLVGGLTTVINSTMTNDFRYSYTRNFWQWGSVNAPVQIPGLGGAVEIAPGSSSTNAESTSALIPYNVNTQNVRQRFWDGQDQMFKDDVSKIMGNHIFQFGGQYLRNNDYHMRTDNGNGVNNAIVYQVGAGGINFTGFNYPTGLAASNDSIFQRLYSEALGLVTQPQVAYTRSGSNLTIQPVGSVAYEHSIIPSYELYAADTWHLKPTLTLTYGLAWDAQLPPYELNGNQVLPVDANGKVLDPNQYINARRAAALAGQVYNPTVGFETIRGTGRKYPYNPVWNQWSPRAAIAWNPKFSSGLLGTLFGDGKTVIRGGYGRIYGRLNGVDLVLVPLLGPGLLQAVSCPNPNIQGVCNSSVTAANAFRIGTDGLTAPLPAPSQTLAQPYFPGPAFGNPAAQDPSVLDPNYRPESTDNFTFSLQRAIGSKMTIETGYIGRLIHHETQNVNVDAVPYMTTLGGQTFANAYANVYLSLCGAAYCSSTPSSAAVAAVPVQPFLEAAFGGPNSAYCKGAASCTARFVGLNVANFATTSVSTIWRNLNTGQTANGVAYPGWTLPQSMMDVSQQITSLVYIASGGYGNYNALYATYRIRDFHGLSTTSNFTWGRSLGTAAQTQASSSYTQLDAFNINANYGPNGFDYKFLFNNAVSWETPWYKAQHGILGHIAGGWVISTILTAQSGAPEGVTYSQNTLCGGQCQSFGESSSSSIVSYADWAVAAAPYTGGSSAHYNVTGSNGIGTNNSPGVNQFANPAQVYSEFRPCILGYDTSCGGAGNIRGLPQWNVDAGVLKDIAVWKEGRVGATLSFQITNVLNHVVMSNPAAVATASSNLSLSTPTQFGRITSAANTPRNMEFGLRIHF
jgi:hypothetical protein